MELDHAQTESSFRNVDLYRYYASSDAHSGLYVARLDGRGGQTPTSNKLTRVLRVEPDDTLTFTAWGRVAANFNGPIRRAARPGRLRPLLLLGSDALAGNQALSGLPDQSRPSQRSSATSRLWSRVAAGVGLTIGSETNSETTGQPFPPTLTRAWIAYYMRYDDGTVESGLAYLPQGTPAGWAAVQVALRSKQRGTLELTAGTDETSGYTYFDDLRVEQTGGLIVQEQHQYAYGSPLTGLNYAVGDKRYRHGYQGQFAEKDAETGYESFELRLYNARIGRWMSGDPAGQFDSPYLGMGNDPVSGTDPDGGWMFSPTGAVIGAVVGGLTGGIISQSNGGNFWSGFGIGAAVGAATGGILGGMRDNGYSHTASSWDKFRDVFGEGQRLGGFYNRGTEKAFTGTLTKNIHKEFFGSTIHSNLTVKVGASRHIMAGSFLNTIAKTSMLSLYRSSKLISVTTGISTVPGFFPSYGKSFTAVSPVNITGSPLKATTTTVGGSTSTSLDEVEVPGAHREIQVVLKVRNVKYKNIDVHWKRNSMSVSSLKKL